MLLCISETVVYFFKNFRPKFRSYKPQDESLQKEKLQDAEPSLVDEEVKDLVEAGKEKVIDKNICIMNVVNV